MKPEEDVPSGDRRARPGLLAAWKPLGILVALRLAFGLAVGALPSGAVLDRARHFPSGELALFERDGVLVAELVRRAPSLSGLGITFGALAALSYVLSLPLLAALIHVLARGRGAFADDISRGLRSAPSFVLVAGLGAVVLAFAVYMGATTSASLVALFPPGTPSRAVASLVIGGIGLVPAAFGATYFDLLRVQVVLGQEGWSARLLSAWRTLSRAPFRATLRYGVICVASALVAASSVTLAASALVRPGALFVWLGVVVGVVALIVLVLLRGVWFGFLVRLSTNELEALRLPEGLGYEARVPSEGSSQSD